MIEDEIRLIYDLITSKRGQQSGVTYHKLSQIEVNSIFLTDKFLCELEEDLFESVAPDAV